MLEKRLHPRVHDALHLVSLAVHALLVEETLAHLCLGFSIRGRTLFPALVAGQTLLLFSFVYPVLFRPLCSPVRPLARQPFLLFSLVLTVLFWPLCALVRPLCNVRPLFRMVPAVQNFFRFSLASPIPIRTLCGDHDHGHDHVACLDSDRIHTPECRTLRPV